jgi:hypothetical protein
MVMAKKRIVLFTAASILLCATIVTVFASFYADNHESVAATNVTNQENAFSDVSTSDWFYSDVEYAYKNGLMNGTGRNTFSPATTTTRGMIVTILWRLEGELIEVGKTFMDVKNGLYYYDAVAWASNNQIISGYNETEFGPDDAVTREQLATLIYRYAAYKKYNLAKKSTLDEYADKSQISDYAVSSIQWAHANGIITGTSSNTLSPMDYAQRSQVATILKRFCTQFAGLNTNDAKDEIAETEKASSPPTSGNNETSNNGGTSSAGGSSSGGSSGSTPKPSEDVENSHPSIVVSNKTAKPGDDVQLAIQVDNNPGILGMTLTMYYDESSCTLKSVENGEAFKGVLELTTSKTLNSGTRFVWYGVDIAQNDIKDGSILLMNFSVPKDAKVGKYPITVKFFDGDVIDKNLAGVPLVIENGYIEVTAK